MKQYWFGELHPSTTEKYMNRMYGHLDLAFEMCEGRIIVRVVKRDD